MSDRTALVENFAKALGELVVPALNDIMDTLTEEGRAKLAGVLQADPGALRLTVCPSPLVIVGSLRGEDPSKPIVLFRITGDHLPPVRWN